MVAHLRARDGDDCWLCRRPIREGDATIEHLVARANGGTNDPANLALCHHGCNAHLRDRPLPRKLKMRDRWHRQADRQQASSG
jgi:5-methylcytosine-specific restriction endonuclease McrA